MSTCFNNKEVNFKKKNKYSTVWLEETERPRAGQFLWFPRSSHIACETLNPIYTDSETRLPGFEF